MTNSALEKQYRVNPGVAVRHIRNEWFFINPATAELHNLVENDLNVWDLIMQGWTPGQIIKKILVDTDGVPDDVTRDIEELFDRFVEKGILRPLS